MVGGSWHCLGALPAGEGLGGEGPCSQKALPGSYLRSLPSLHDLGLRLTTPGKVWRHWVSTEGWGGRVVVLGPRSTPSPTPSRTGR